MKVATGQEMREIDRITIEDYGIPGLVLMERAGLAVALKVKEFYPDKKIVILCGGGNNGGDGIVAARNLHNWGFKVNVLIFAKKNALSADCNTQYQIAKKFGIPIEFRDSINERDIHGAVVIDAIFGTGLSRYVKGNLIEVFAFINASGVPVVAVDIPSGVSSDTGEILGEAIMADITVTFGLPKVGHFLHPGAEYSGKLFVEDIGFPAELICSEVLKVNLINSQTASSLIPARYINSHKGDYGHVLVIAGSKGKTGAALMTAKACLRSGSGLVTLAVPESLANVFQDRVTEEMTLPLPDDGRGVISLKAVDVILKFIAGKIDAIAVGPGIGVSSDMERVMTELIQKSTVPLVIDADGINSIAEGVPRKILTKAKSPVILTPHTGEMARLLSASSTKGQWSMEVRKNRIDIARAFSKETGAYLVLKGTPTIVANPEGSVFINTTGNPGMATAGSGDVLTGIIASLLGQGLNPQNASLFGVYMHGLAGDIAAESIGEHSLIASDIIGFLPDAFLKLQG
ncbi:bifunctional NAD(P)H-hydrate repair enzyme Nnr [Dissulfurispira thermophila]|uniref:Bifunctional NAD(P)H-hydrate repair enzyme n=2 Tax=Dissulfurispira thermophila TaxID=2715679 RepID=A0A7G1H2A2_9BACT|nr:bifunctional NAD(P)H-hydrate repair enzyme Nnr [Dissulfurispira thermophila]